MSEHPLQGLMDVALQLSLIHIFYLLGTFHENHFDRWLGYSMEDVLSLSLIHIFLRLFRLRAKAE